MFSHPLLLFILACAATSVACSEDTPEQLKLLSPDRYTGVRKFTMECFMMILLIIVVHSVIHSKRTSKTAWLWRKKMGVIHSWDDLRDASGYDMVLPAESTVFNQFFFDRDGKKIFGVDPSKNGKPKDLTQYALRLKQETLTNIKNNAPANQQKQLLDQAEAQTWLHVAKQIWCNSARVGLLYRALALRPLILKIDQDYPEMQRMHLLGLCTTDSFKSVEGAMLMIKAEINELNELAKEVGYLNKHLTQGPNVWNLAGILFDFGKQVEQVNLRKQEEHNQEEHNKNE
tara:strand:+ start:5669 stop:6529 length:861 start_codon:yes stop_codon:yes gene_type:complete